MIRSIVFFLSSWQRCILTPALAVVLAPSSVMAQTAAGGSQDESKLPATIRAEQITGHPDREMTAESDVEFTRGDTRVTADKATYHVIEDQVDAAGDICMQRHGDLYTGDELKLKINAGEGFVTNPTYHLERNNANGNAQRINFEGEDRATVINGTYSTCEGPDPDWYLKSSTLHLDNGRDVGTARNTLLYFKDVPILGTPAISFPLSDARKSGVLPPTIGITNKSGLEVMVPYYFNIAPNRDLTLYPNLIARRGLQLGAQGRYLGRSYSGETHIEFLPNDRQTGSNRYAGSSIHSQTLAPNLAWTWNLNAASDDDYPNDFSRTITTASQRLLLRDTGLGYSSTYWNAAVRMSAYQVLQDPTAPIGKPYSRLPQVTLNAGRQDVGGFDWGFNSELTRFWSNEVVNGNLPVRGNRLAMTPQVSYPFLRPGYFVTPKLSFDFTQYRLDHVAAGTPTDFSRALPTFSVDSGLIFERDASFFGKDMTQTLEPRLFYVRTPYRDQSRFPNFDTAPAELSFAQLFSENRFIGRDRISDANQLTTAVVSRYIESDGAERMRLAVGQRFYFSPQRVTLGVASNDIRSDLLLSAAGQINKAWNVESNVQFSQSEHTVNRANAGIQWQPAPKHVVNLFYRRDLFYPLDPVQYEASAQWPIASRWYAVGRVNYSMKNRKVAEGLFGAEYKASCWVFRMVAQRIPTAAKKATSAIFFQLELNGLTRLGSNPLDALRTSIPGYQLINKP